MFNTKLNEQQYPNLVAEIRIHGYSNRTFADHGNITEELLEAFLRGEEKITFQEAYGMARCINSLQNLWFSLDYLLSSKFGYYDMAKKKHRRKVMTIYKLCDRKRAAVDFRQMFEFGYITKFDMKRMTDKAAHMITAEQAARYRYIGRVLVNQALRFMADIEQLIVKHEAPKPRGITVK